MAQSRSSLLFALQHVAYVICKVLGRFNPPCINLPLAFNIDGFFKLFVPDSYVNMFLFSVGSLQLVWSGIKTKCRPGDRHLWLLAAVASCSCASGFLSRMCSRFPLLAARVSGQRASAPGSNRSQRLSIQLLFNSKKDVFLSPRMLGINICNHPYFLLMVIKPEDWLEDAQEEYVMK